MFTKIQMGFENMLLTLLSCSPNILMQNFVIILKGQNLLQKCSFLWKAKL